MPVIIDKLRSLVSGLAERLTKNEHVKRYFYNTGWMLADRFVRLFSAIILGILIVRYLGPGDYGLLNVALAYVGLFIPIASLGLGDLAIRELLKHRYPERVILGTLFYLRFSAAFLSFSAILIAITLSHKEPLVKVLVPFLAFSVIFQSFDILDKFFQSHVKAKYTARATVIALSLSSVIKLSLIYFEAPLLYFGFAYGFEYVLLAAGLIWQFRLFRIRFSEMIFDIRLALEFLKDSWALTLSGLMVTVFTRIDAQMIDDQLGYTAVGNYSAAVKISEAVHIIPLAITNSLMPAIITGYEIGKDVFKERLQKLYDILTWIAIPCAIVISLCAPYIVLVFGSKFTGVDDVLAIHIWSCVFVFWGAMVAKWYVIVKMPRFVTLNTIAGAAVNICLNFLLIPAYGIKGAAVATIAAHLSAVVIVPLFLNKPRMLVGLMIKSLNPVAAFKRIRTLRYSNES